MSKKAVSIGVQDHVPDTSLDWTIDVPPEYDLVGKDAVFELRAGPSQAVAFRLSAAAGLPDLSIAGQQVLLRLNPATESPDFVGETLATMFASEGTLLEFNLDIQEIGQALVSYRIQGSLRRLPSHGELK